jgi:hypothetical protein
VDPCLLALKRLRGFKAATTGAPNRFVNGGAPVRIAITNFHYPIPADANITPDRSRTQLSVGQCRFSNKLHLWIPKLGTAKSGGCSTGKTEKFYRDLAVQGASVRVGMEARGHARWFVT